MNIALHIAIDTIEEREPGYALGRVTINGVDFHVELIEIVPCTSCFVGDAEPGRHWCTETRAVSPVREAELQGIYSAWGGEGPWACIEHTDGRQFIMLILPHCE